MEDRRRFADYLSAEPTNSDRKPARTTALPVRAWLSPYDEDEPDDIETLHWFLSVEDNGMTDVGDGPLKTLVAEALARGAEEFWVWSKAHSTYERSEQPPV